MNNAIRALRSALAVGASFFAVWLSVAAAEVIPGPYSAAVERVVDGDTLRARVAVWLGQELTVLVRIRGIDAPEIHGRCAGETAQARDAKAALERLVSNGPVALTRIEGGKYFGRVIADVTATSGEDVGAALVAGGFARPYDGGARQPWCEVGLLGPRGDGSMPALPVAR